MSTSGLVLRQELRKLIHDGVRETLTTAIAASASVISTNFRKWDGGVDDFYNDWYCYIEDKANAGVNRVVSDYATATGTGTVFGANLTTDGANLATVMLTKYNPDDYWLALQKASRQIYPELRAHIESRELIVNNWLPNSSFEDQSTAGTPDFYTHLTTTGVETTTAGLYRGRLGTKSIKLTAGAANDYMYISSINFPRLLNLMGQTVDFKCWVYPEVADDAALVIYTLKADGTAQTLTSTTTCPALKQTLLELENQTLNDDLVLIEFRFKIITNAKYAYFDNARVIGQNLWEYLLPTDFRTGELEKVYIQTSGWADDPCDDLHLKTKEEVKNCEIVNDGTYKWLRLPYAYTSKYLLELEGYKPLETLSTDASTVFVETHKLDLLLAQAAVELYTIQQGMVSSRDRDAFKTEIAWWQDEVRRLKGSYSEPQSITVKFRK